MSDPTYGHWHDLTVSESVLIDVGRGPEAPDPSERIDHYLTHPPQCGRGCHTCGTHPHCDVEYQVTAAGPEAYGDLKPGQYKVRCWYHRSPSGPWGDAEWDAGIEAVAADDFDAAEDGAK
ncbi:MAG TPA: hypothetical protein VG411_20410 [Actinomycetota bacterium]|nr:hypothetical protein [Actinomycetota bacterium]